MVFCNISNFISIQDEFSFQAEPFPRSLSCFLSEAAVPGLCNNIQVGILVFCPDIEKLFFPFITIFNNSVFLTVDRFGCYLETFSVRKNE